jgi:hypothetical protein
MVRVSAFSDVTVYGVDVAGCDGKVGMACVVLTDGLQDRCGPSLSHVAACIVLLLSTS